jgi:hypothetical protein
LFLICEAYEATCNSAIESPLELVLLQAFLFCQGISSFGSPLLNYQLFMSLATLVHKTFCLRNLKGLMTRLGSFNILGQQSFLGPNLL